MFRRFFKVPILLIFLTLLHPDSINLREITEKMEKIGGLKFKYLPEVVYIDSEKLNTLLLEQTNNREAEIFFSMGMIESKDVYIKIKRKIFTTGGVGFFSPQMPHRIFISKGWGNFYEKFALVHELRHCLQYQYFPKDFAFLQKGLLGEDKTTAILALLEGDANFLTLRYFGIQNFPMNFTILKLGQKVEGKLLESILTFIYKDGYEKVRNQYLKSGWKGVFALLSSPPSSTALFKDKIYIHPQCSCNHPYALGPLTYKVILGTLADHLIGDCLCLDGEKVRGIMLFDSEENSSLASSKFSYKIKWKREGKKIIFQAEVKYDSSNSGKKRDDIKN